MNRVCASLRQFVCWAVTQKALARLPPKEFRSSIEIAALVGQVAEGCFRMTEVACDPLSMGILFRFDLSYLCISYFMLPFAFFRCSPTARVWQDKWAEVWPLPVLWTKIATHTFCQESSRHFLYVKCFIWTASVQIYSSFPKLLAPSNKNWLGLPRDCYAKLLAKFEGLSSYEPLAEQYTSRNVPCRRSSLRQKLMQNLATAAALNSIRWRKIRIFATLNYRKEC